MEDKLFNLLGLGVPFYLGAATYAVFAWLDSNASDEVTKVISSWLHGRSHNKPDLGNLIIRAFDRLYTSPLLSFRAFRRSAVLSTVTWLFLYLFPWLIQVFGTGTDGFNDLFSPTNRSPRLFITAFTVLLTITALVDYASLLFVRRFLGLARIHPIGITLLSSIVGLTGVLVGYMTFIIIFFFIYFSYVSVPIRSLRFSVVVLLARQFEPWFLPTFIGAMRPAFTVHLWLPLFAISSLVVQFIYWSFRAVEKAQWFLKQGDAHPLKAIGIVATIIVFGSAMLVKEGWALLGALERS